MASVCLLVAALLGLAAFHSTATPTPPTLRMTKGCGWSALEAQPLHAPGPCVGWLRRSDFLRASLAQGEASLQAQRGHSEERHVCALCVIVCCRCTCVPGVCCACTQVWCVCCVCARTYTTCACVLCICVWCEYGVCVCVCKVYVSTLYMCVHVMMCVFPRRRAWPGSCSLRRAPPGPTVTGHPTCHVTPSLWLLLLDCFDLSWEEGSPYSVVTPILAQSLC